MVGPRLSHPGSARRRTNCALPRRCATRPKERPSYAVRGPMRVASFVLLVTLPLAGCAARRPPAETIPPIAVSPGVAARIALLDRYNLHDGARRHMTKR